MDKLAGADILGPLSKSCHIAPVTHHSPLASMLLSTRWNYLSESVAYSFKYRLRIHSQFLPWAYNALQNLVPARGLEHQH